MMDRAISNKRLSPPESADARRVRGSAGLSYK